MKVLLVNSAEDPVRLAFPSLFSKREGFLNKDGTRGAAKFEATFIIRPGGKNEAKIKEAIAAACREAWGPKWETFYAELAADNRCLRKGDTKVNAAGEIYDGFEGNKYVVAKNIKRPGVFDKDAKTPLVEEDGKPYGGCFVHAEIDVWALKPRAGVKRTLAADLLGVVFNKKGDAFGAGSAPSTAGSFAGLGVGDDDDDDAGEAPSAPSGRSVLDD